MTAQTLSPKFQRRAEERPEELLDAALALFSAQGYQATSVAQIAQAAGLSKGAVYLYFPAKRDILTAVIARSLGPIVAHTETFAALAALPARATLRTVAEALGHVLDDPSQRRLAVMILRDIGTVPEMAQSYNSVVLERAMPALRLILARAIASGEMGAHSPDLAMHMLLGAICSQLILSEFIGLAQPPFSVSLPGYLDILFAGLDPREGA